MKKLSQFIVLFMLGGVLAGCFIQSIRPFYTDDLVIELPAVRGEWMLVRQGEDDCTEKYAQPWLFSENQILTFDENIGSFLDVIYFRIDSTIFVDLIAPLPKPDKGLNQWWTFHMLPVHSVCKLELTDSTLVLTPLDGEWLAKQLTAKEITLSYVDIDGDGDHIVLTATTAELARFLKLHAQSGTAFPAANRYLFHRKAAPPSRT